jgi:hypothetical protein
VSVDKDAGRGITEQEWVRRRLDSEVAAVKKPGMTNAEIAERISEDLRGLFWRRALNAYFAKELD